MHKLLEILRMPAIMCGLAVHTLAAILLVDMIAPETPLWLRFVDFVCIFAFVSDYWMVWRRRLK